jgi:RimJ/RimL family protein N-acetyltransferase
MSSDCLSLLKFDSDVFGVPYYRVTLIDAPELADELAERQSHGPLIADAKLAAGDVEQEGRFTRLGFRRVSTQHRLIAKCAEDNGTLDTVQMSDRLALDPADITAHAASFRFSRFFQDPMVPPEDALRFMETWISNSLNGRRKVVAIGRNFCTYHERDAAIEIDLLSCLDRKQGIAARLLAAVREIAFSEGLPAVHVVTEGENAPALRTYASAGFGLSEALLAMHLVHRPDTGQQG